MLLAALAAVVLLVSAALLVGGARTVSGRPVAAVQLEQLGPAGVVPPGLDAFYGQQLAWSDCEPFAAGREERAAFRASGVRCAHVEVPLDYAEPDGDTARIGLLRWLAKDPSRRIGSLLVNPGGPGASGMVAAASLIGSVAGTELGDRFDLVGFDPRGVGASSPQVRCLTTEERHADRLEVDTDGSPAGVERFEQRSQDYAAKCAERVGVDALANLGSRDVARDMDVIRSVLGDEQLTYLGYSYGTRIGTAYADAFTGNVRAMVLDGALDPAQDPVEEVVAQVGGFQGAFDAYLEHCVASNRCPLGDDQAKATEVFQELVFPLQEQPVEVGERLLSYTDATTAVIAALYDDQLWGLLTQGLAELAGGEGAVLLYLADSYYGYDRTSGEYSTLIDAFTAIRCVDDQPVTDRAQAKLADQQARQAAPFLDDGAEPSGALDACAFWPAPPTGRVGLPEVDGLPPVLVISTTGDPATPYQAGVALAEALDGRLLTYNATQHTAFLQDSECVDEAAVAYLVDGTLPAEGAECS